MNPKLYSKGDIPQSYLQDLPYMVKFVGEEHKKFYTVVKMTDKTAFLLELRQWYYISDLKFYLEFRPN